MTEATITVRTAEEAAISYLMEQAVQTAKSRDVDDVYTIDVDSAHSQGLTVATLNTPAFLRAVEHGASKNGLSFHSASGRDFQFAKKHNR